MNVKIKTDGDTFEIETQVRYKGFTYLHTDHTILVPSVIVVSSFNDGTIGSR